ncbi:rCG48752 [Rattus norvegicus]|uniref:RCG48752 n=1 Tax=Rattus norvegicus TaxID=10116 RepID=A6IGR2_RAT|nr:rCG48752 [Rattus norvegicus]
MTSAPTSVIRSLRSALQAFSVRRV